MYRKKVLILHAYYGISEIILTSLYPSLHIAGRKRLFLLRVPVQNRYSCCIGH